MLFPASHQSCAVDQLSSTFSVHLFVISEVQHSVVTFLLVHTSKTWAFKWSKSKNITKLCWTPDIQDQSLAHMLKARAMSLCLTTARSELGPTYRPAVHRRTHNVEETPTVFN